MTPFVPELDETEGAHAPDWGRYLVQGKGGAPVGDPTRWGALAQTPVNRTSGSPIFSDQIIAVATRDGYSRSWAVIGSLTLPLSTWNTPDDDWGLIGFRCVLEVVMGVGQVQLVHQIVVMQGPNRGLCATQSIRNGGPYAPSYADYTGNPDAEEARPFAAIGALVGQTIAIRAAYHIGEPAGGLPAVAKLSLVVTPFAAGERL